MSNLINLLKEQTVTLKEQYVQKTIDWANKDYQRYVEMKTWNEEKWAKHFGVETRIANPGTSMEFITFDRRFYNSREYKVYKNLQNTIHQALSLGLNKYIERAKSNAEMHYESSIIKLSDRILKKGLNEENLKLTTSHIGVNIETTITDGVKTVRAFTIIAEGEIQCPHYRYLVK
jgi:hypothetical protein